MKASALHALIVLCASVAFSFGAEIHDAVKSGDIQKVKSILALEPDAINAKGDDGKTPLHEAVLRGNKVMVEYLLDCKADPSATDKHGWTPYRWAKAYNQNGIAELVKSTAITDGSTNTSTSATARTNSSIARFQVPIRVAGSNLVKAGFEPQTDATRKGLAVYKKEWTLVQLYYDEHGITEVHVIVASSFFTQSYKEAGFSTDQVAKKLFGQPFIVSEALRKIFEDSNPDVPDWYDERWNQYVSLIKASEKEEPYDVIKVKEKAQLDLCVIETSIFKVCPIVMVKAVKNGEATTTRRAPLLKSRD